MDAKLNILVPSVPGSLRITQGMWEDFIMDPVLAAWVIFQISLDAFQSARLRYYWWCQHVIDSSGFSSGKTIVDFLFVNLRCILIPDHDAGVYYPVFDTGKNTFWTYFDKIKAPIFRSQLGKLDEKGEDSGHGSTRGSGCYTAHYKAGGTLKMPAPSFAKDASTQSSLRFNTLLGEEWTHIDAMSEGIDKQLIQRVTKPCWNQHHPIWGNHILLTAPAKTRMHPAYRRFKRHEKMVKAGDPRWANLHYSYKDFSDLLCHTGKTFKEEYRIESTLQMKRETTSAEDALGEMYGVWGAHGIGWFTEAAILNCVEQGSRRNVRPVSSRSEMERLVESEPEMVA